MLPARWCAGPCKPQCALSAAHHADGCVWKGEVRDFAQHQAGCNFQPARPSAPPSVGLADNAMSADSLKLLRESNDGKGTLTVSEAAQSSLVRTPVGAERHWTRLHFGGRLQRATATLRAL